MEITFSTKEVERILEEYVMDSFGEILDGKKIKVDSKSYMGLEATVSISDPVAEAEKE